MKQYEEHPLASIFPMMPEKDLNELAEDIKQFGLRAPITLFDNQILDGRNRYKACEIAGVAPRFKDFNGDGDPLDFVISANVHRRQLTPSQRAMVAAKIANLKHGQKKADAPRGASAEAVSQTEAAEQLDVGRRSVQRAAHVLKEAEPADIKAVESGEKTVNEIAKKVKAKAEKPVGQLDKTGYGIPESVLFDWQRAEETARHLMRSISDARSEQLAVSRSSVQWPSG